MSGEETPKATGICTPLLAPLYPQHYCIYIRNTPQLKYLLLLLLLLLPLLPPTNLPSLGHTQHNHNQDKTKSKPPQTNK
ncbi:uncharacterized protein BO80DRAFT_426534 [Aspergillus ibericus CBS 121593]|uniref:Uncharacterized protein n=1 Tax=Aspergillus ibericus CBS 121593 TaxID=1448316 RepID=A0A395GVX0_9EURO|nr:hypothetical protein BO80DRAFT_426534 [Aspergillus ibericus CBS 121593]RAK99552.1 hypothetical protein BO80DRAFT_426534 [Aspergillus ibericus CBS 121593]